LRHFPFKQPQYTATYLYSAWKNRNDKSKPKKGLAKPLLAMLLNENKEFMHWPGMQCWAQDNVCPSCPVCVVGRRWLALRLSFFFYGHSSQDREFQKFFARVNSNSKCSIRSTQAHVVNRKIKERVNRWFVSGQHGVNWSDHGNISMA